LVCKLSVKKYPVKTFQTSIIPTGKSAVTRQINAQKNRNAYKTAKKKKKTLDAQKNIETTIYACRSILIAELGTSTVARP
jgi:hypothetical protein